MLEAVADTETTPQLPEKIDSQPKVRPAEKIFSFTPSKGPISGDHAPSDASHLEIKVQPADTRFGPALPKNAEKVSKPSLFIRVLRNGARAAFVVFLCAFAWAGGAYYAHGRLPVDLVKSSQAPELAQSPAHDDIAGAVQRMSEQIGALKAEIDSRGAAPDAGIKNAQSQHQLDSAQPATGTAIADLSGKVDKLEADFTAKLSQVDDQLANIEKQVSAPRAALASREHSLRKRAARSHDAFNPAADPSAPGAPRPLGAR